MVAFFEGFEEVDSWEGRQFGFFGFLVGSFVVEVAGYGEEFGGGGGMVGVSLNERVANGIGLRVVGDGTGDGIGVVGWCTQGRMDFFWWSRRFVL